MGRLAGLSMVAFLLFSPTTIQSAQRRPHMPPSDRINCAIFGLSHPSAYDGWIYVCPPDVADDPLWADPTSDPVPLPVHDAVRKSRDVLRAFDPREPHWQVKSISLTGVPGGRWVYLIDWMVPDSSKGISYVVTLAGKVISPELH